MFRPAERDSRIEVSAEPLPPIDKPRKTGRLRRWLIAIGILVGVLLVLVGIKASQIFTMVKAGKSMLPPPESVTAVQAKTSEWRPVRSAVGTLVAVRAVTLSAEITGAVKEIAFEHGFWELGRFAVLYRSLYGESPSVTLARRD